MVLTASGILNEGVAEINRGTGEAVKQKLILSNVDKCFMLPNSYISRKYGLEVCIPTANECEIAGVQAAAPFSVETSGL